jgi:hypothetical protein
MTGGGWQLNGVEFAKKTRLSPSESQGDLASVKAGSRAS